MAAAAPHGGICMNIMSIFERLRGLLRHVVTGKGAGDALLLLIYGAGVIALFLGVFLSVQAGLLFLAAAWIVAGSWTYPKTAFALLLFFAPLLPLLKATQVLGAITPLKDVVILTLFLRTTLLPILLKRDPYRKNPLLIPLLFFIGWAVISALRADHLLLGALRLRDLLLYLPMLWIARNLIRTREDVQLFLRTIIGSATLTLILVSIQFLVFPDGMVLRFLPESNTWIPRASGTLAHPNLLGSFLLFLLPLTLGLSLEKYFHPLRRLTLAAVTMAGMGALVMTYSRSAWIAMVAALGMLALFAIAQKKRLIVPVLFFAVLSGSIVLTVAPAARVFLRTIVDPTYASNRERLEILSGLLASASPASVIVGEGLGDVLSSTMRTVNLTLSDVVSADTRRVQVAKARTFVDNAILKTGIEQGIVGIVLMGWVTWHVLLLAWKGQRAEANAPGRAIARALGATTVGLIILSLFLDVPEIFPVALLFWTFIGVVQALPYMMEGTGNREQGRL